MSETDRQSLHEALDCICPGPDTIRGDCPVHSAPPPTPERMDSPLHRLRYVIVRADEAKRQPIDQNYVAISKDAWEEIMELIRRV